MGYAMYDVAYSNAGAYSFKHIFLNRECGVMKVIKDLVLDSASQKNAFAKLCAPSLVPAIIERRSFKQLSLTSKFQESQLNALGPFAPPKIKSVSELLAKHRLLNKFGVYNMKGP